MKPFFLGLLGLGLALTLGCAMAKAVPVTRLTLAWTASTSPNITNYTVMYGTNSGQYFKSIKVKTITQYTLVGMPTNQIYYFVVTAANQRGDTSVWSNEASGHTVLH